MENGGGAKSGESLEKFLWSDRVGLYQSTVQPNRQDPDRANLCVVSHS